MALVLDPTQVAKLNLLDAAFFLYAPGVNLTEAPLENEALKQGLHLLRKPTSKAREPAKQTSSWDGLGFRMFRAWVLV